MGETISLQEVILVIKKRLLLILLITVGAVTIAAVVSYFVFTPIYESNTQFIVNQSDISNTKEAYIDPGTIQTNVELIKTYNVIIKSNAILGDVIKKLDLPIATDKLKKNILVSSEEDSQVVTVTVKDPDPELATDIANTTVDTFKDKIVDIMNVDNVNVLTAAETKSSKTPVTPRPKLNIAIAVVVGIVTGIGLAYLLELMDTTIRTQEDVERELDVPVIGVIFAMKSKHTQTHREQINNTSIGGKQCAKI